MAKPKILIIENSIAVTGALKSIIRSSLSLQDQYHFIFVMPAKSTAISYVRQNGFDCMELEMREIRKSVSALLLYLPFLILNTKRIFQIVKLKQIDIISNNDFYNLLPALYRLCGGKVPYVTYVRFLPNKFPSILVQLWYGLHVKSASSVIAVSEAVKRQLKPSKKLVVVPNELPQDEVEYKPPYSTEILYVANYIAGKGHYKALESFARLDERFSSWHLKFIGGDMGLQKNQNYKHELMQKAHMLGIADRVQWNSFSENIGKEYSRAGLILNFSESESFSLTCLEAMYYGRPLIATRCGGPEEIIEDGYSGILVPVGDTIAMAEAMEKLMGDKDQRLRLAANAFDSIRERFAYNNTIGKLKIVYQNALRSINNF